MVAGRGLMSTSRGQANSDPSPLWEQFQVVHRADPNCCPYPLQQGTLPPTPGSSAQGFGPSGSFLRQRPLPTPGLVVLLTLLLARSGTVHPWDRVDWTVPSLSLQVRGGQSPPESTLSSLLFLLMQA